MKVWLKAGVIIFYSIHAIDDFFAFALAGTIYAEAFRDNTSGGYPGAMDGRDRGSGCMG